MRKIDSWAKDARAWTQMWTGEIELNQILPHRKQYSVPGYSAARNMIIECCKNIARLLSR